jgi:hypothetical protein
VNVISFPRVVSSTFVTPTWMVKSPRPIYKVYNIRLLGLLERHSLDRCISHLKENMWKIFLGCTYKKLGFLIADGVGNSCGDPDFMSITK